MPKDIVKDLLENNENYTINREVLDAIKKGQSPKITMVTCSDSRVSGHIMNRDMVNHVFHIRNIGNQIENNYGSVDYGVHHLKTPVLLILGHTDCGAIKASQKDFTAESDEIRKELYPLHFNLSHTAKTLSNSDTNFVSKLVQANVDRQVKMAKERYGDNVSIVGAIFDIHGHFNEKEGRIIITNIDGQTDESALKNSALLSNLSEEMRDIRVCRL